LFSPDAKSLLCYGSSRDIELWDVVSGRVRLRSPWESGWEPHPFCFSQDGNLLAIQNPGATSLTVWDARTGKPVRTQSWRDLSRLQLAGGPDIIGLSTQFAYDGKTAASVSVAGGTHAWNYVTGVDLGLLPTERFSEIMGFTAGARGILTTRPSWPGICPVGEAKKMNEEDLELWALASRTKVSHWRMDRRLVAFSPKSELLACGYDNGAVKLWNLRRLLEKTPDN
jgi:WD40 repeat protein